MKFELWEIMLLAVTLFLQGVILGYYIGTVRESKNWIKCDNGHMQIGDGISLSGAFQVRKDKRKEADRET